MSVVDLLEKRRNRRYPVNFQVDLVSGRERVRGRALDFGAGGMRLRLERPLERGARLTVDGLPYERLNGREGPSASVAWVKSSGPEVELGLQFLEKPAYFQRDSRSQATSPVREQLSARLMAEGGEPVWGTLARLSLDQAVTLSDERPPRGQQVTLRLATVELTGRVSDVRLTAPDHGSAWECRIDLDALRPATRSELERFIGVLSRTN